MELAVHFSKQNILCLQIEKLYIRDPAILVPTLQNYCSSEVLDILRFSWGKKI
jgi:hypothetical protein